MSLSARIAIDPSRRIALAGVIMPIGGVVATAVAVAARWPAGAGVLGIVVLVALIISAAIVAGAIRTWRRDGRRVLVVSDRAEFDVVAEGGAGLETSWRLVDTTMAWPGFAVLAMRQDEGRAVVRMPVATAALGALDRRALDRFLLWSLRGGGASVAPASRPAGVR